MTPVASFERTYLVVERSLEDSTSYEERYFSRNRKEEVSSIFEQRRGRDTSNSGRNVKEFSFNEED